MNETHLFRCAACRAERRLSRALRSLPGPSAMEVEDPVDESFVQRVLHALRDDRRRRALLLARLAAAAALLFFFFLGAGRQKAVSTAQGAEQAYTQLAASNGFDELLPE